MNSTVDESIYSICNESGSGVVGDTSKTEPGELGSTHYLYFTGKIEVYCILEDKIYAGLICRNYENNGKQK